MNTKQLLLPIALACMCQPAAADVNGLPSSSPLGDLQAQVAALTSRVNTLEANKADSDVDGRTYCMMVEVTILRGPTANTAESLETRVIKRFASFSGGSLIATLISGTSNVQDDNGIVSSISPPAMSPPVLEATYMQDGARLDLSFADPIGDTRVWYVSRDGSVIHSNSVVYNSFPNSLTLGLARHATLIESDSCDDG